LTLVKMPAKSPKGSKKLASKVTKKKYKPLNARQQNIITSSGLSDFLQTKAELDKAHLADQIEHEKGRRAEVKEHERLKLAKELLADGTSEPNVLATAKAPVLKHLKDRE